MNDSKHQERQVEMNEVVTYQAGEKTCETCGEALGRIECPEARTRFFCSRPECRYPLHLNVPIQFLSRDRLCDAEGCNKPAERRAYPAHQKKFYCSDECRKRSRRPRGSSRVHCACCGQDLGYRKPSKSGLHYCYGHEAAQRKARNAAEKCGPFLSLYERYEGFADDHYRDGKGPLAEVRKFLAFAHEKGILSMENVTVEVIDEYCADLRRAGKQCRPDFVKVFFDFLLANGLMECGNPVRPALHYQARAQNLPRVASSTSINRLWIWLEERGDTRAKLITALMQESGFLPSTICEIRTHDVDLERRRIHLRRINRKPGESEFLHWAFFGELSAQWLRVWLNERPNRGHDYLLTNAEGDPLRRHALRDLLNGVFLKRSKFRSWEDGLEKFDFRMLRDTNIFHLRTGGFGDDANMRQHGLLALASVKRFDRLLTQEEIEQLR